MKMNNQKKGLIFAFISAIISGFSIFYNKQVVISGIDPVIFNIIKNGGVAFILSILLFRKFKTRNLFFRKITDKRLILIGITGGSIPFILFFQGLTHVAAANANLIQKSLFIWVLIMAVAFLNEKIRPVQIIGYLLVIYGNFFIGGLTGFKASIYEGMILAAAVLWSIENIISKKVLETNESEFVAWGRMFFGTVVLIAIALFSGKTGVVSGLSLNQILPLTGSIALLSLYVFTFYKALKFAPATTVTAILVLATPITNILSVVFISHKIPSSVSLNTGIILLGVLLISLGFKWRNRIAV